MADILTYRGLNKLFFDHIAKNVFDYIEQELGSENDNSYEDITIPFMCDGWVEGNTGYSAEYFVNGLYNTYIRTNYMFHVNINGNYNTENFIDLYVPIWHDSRAGDVTIEQAYDRINSSGTSGIYLDNAIKELDFAQLQAEQFKLRLNDGMSQQTIFSKYTNYGVQYYTELYTINDNTKIYDSFTRYNIYQRPPVDVLNITKIKFDTRSSVFNTNIAHSSNSVNTDLSFNRSYNLFTIADNDTASNVYNTNNSTYNNTYQYTTNDGDTIYVYYGDNYIDFGIGSGGGVGAGGLVGFNYNDFKLIMDDLIDDLKINVPDLDIPQDYQFPTYDDLKYEDMGDFYIEPLHQYDKLPTAPTFDGSIDLGQYPKYIGSSAQTFLNFLPASLSALLAACFIGCIIIRNLKR